MIVKLDSAKSQLILGFLANIRRLPMDKKAKTLLARLFDEVRHNEVNSQRFLHALPVMRWSHDNLRALTDRAYRYRALPRWSRLLVLPALALYLTLVLPRRVKTMRSLNRVALAVREVTKACGGKGA